MKRRLRPFLSLLWDGHRAESLAVLVTLLAMLLTEGIGLLLLLPALAAAGVPLGDDGHAGALVTGAQAALRSVGLSATLGWMLVIVALLVSARAAIQLAQSLLSARLEASVVQRLRARLFAAVVEMPWPRFTRERPGALLHALGPQVDDVHTALLLLLHITAQVATVLAVGAVSLLVAPGATALVAAAGIVLVVATGALRAPGIHLADELLLASNNVFARIAELLGAQKMIKAHGAEADATAAITREVANWARRSRHIGGQRATLAFASSVLSVAMLAAIVWLVVRYTSVAPASLLLLLVLYVRLVPRLADMQQSIAVFDQSSSALASVTALLQRCESATGDAGWRTGAVHAATSPAASTRPPALSVRAVTVRYPEAEQPAIEDFSCEIPAGTITVVFGASGAGKTTLGDLLLGLLEPERGTVLVDGQPLAGTVRQRWRDRVGYLAQEPMLLHGTVRENLLLARPRASEVELHEALRAAACDFVDALPQGLDAPVGERGVLVSGGERQRLALARALLRQPGLLVLDEATSALDAETEQRILKTVRALAGRCTVVFCTHREAPRAIADQVIEL